MQILGRVSAVDMFISGGLAGVLMEPRKTFFGNFRKFIGSGAMIAVFGLFMNKEE